MKTLIASTLLIFGLITNSYSQDWAPISSSIKSVFTKSQLPTPLACFSIDSINHISTDSTIYYNYQLYGTNWNDSINYAPCQGFGGDCYIIQNTMSWLGRKIIETNDNWIFITNNSDTLKFNFNNSDTSIVFQNSNRTLKTYRLSDTVNNLFGTLDSIKEYEILQYDASGNIIQDALFGKTIRLSKHYGLLDFIEVRDYSDSIAYYSIIGSSNGIDTVGKTTVKEYEIHQSEVGSITQFENKRATYYTCCPTEHPGYYYLETYETIASYFSNNNYIMTYTGLSPQIDSMVIDTNIVAYKIPFIRNLNNQRVNISIDSTECYGKGYYVTTSFSDCEFFCPTYNCYSMTSADNSGGYCIKSYLDYKPNVQPILTVVDENPPTIIPKRERNLIYTFANGNSCGTRAYSNINNHIKKDEQVIFPNPASDNIFIKSLESEITSILIRNLEGKIVKTIDHQVKTIDISSLPKGIYFIDIHLLDKVFLNSFIKN